MQVQRANNWYPFQVWISTIVIGGPVLISIIGQFYGNGLVSFIQNFSWNMVFIPFGIFYSLPVLGLYYIVYRSLIRKEISPLIIKIILCLLCVAGIVVTLNLIHGSMVPFLSLTYSVSVVFSSFVFKVYLENKEEVISNRG